MLKLFSKRKNQKIEDEIAAIQRGNDDARNSLLHAYRPFIKKAVSKVCRRYVTESDDEFSIGLIAFNHAIDQYSVEKGSSFLTFANVIIQRRVIDYIRKENKMTMVSIDEEETEEQSQSSILTTVSMKEFEKQNEAEERKLEIVSLTSLLREFNLSFQDLVEQTPKHIDARQNAIQVANILSSDPELLQQLLLQKKIPVKELTEKVDVSRKTIERNRKYIIGITLVLSGEFPLLKEYMKEVVEQW